MPRPPRSVTSAPIVVVPDVCAKIRRSELVVPSKEIVPVPENVLSPSSFNRASGALRCTVLVPSSVNPLRIRTCELVDDRFKSPDRVTPSRRLNELLVAVIPCPPVPASTVASFSVPPLIVNVLLTWAVAATSRVPPDNVKASSLARLLIRGLPAPAVTLTTDVAATSAIVTSSPNCGT